jgi:hypothetical protein
MYCDSHLVVVKSRSDISTQVQGCSISRTNLNLSIYLNRSFSSVIRLLEYGENITREKSRDWCKFILLACFLYTGGMARVSYSHFQ